MSSIRRVSRAQCANCTCSPGLLSRNNRRSSLFAKQINLKRTGSLSKGGSRKGSLFTFDMSSICEPETKEVNTSKRLESLRKLMAEHDLGVYIIPSEDEHQSEYVSPADQRRSFISGFLGSAGVAIVTRDVMCMNDVPEGLAALSTDGRYFTQAENELDFNWSLLKRGAKDQPTWEEWTILQASQLSLDSGRKIKIGVDPKLISNKLYEKLSSLVKEKSESADVQIELVAVKKNLISEIWKDFEEVPSQSTNMIKLLDNKYCGQTIIEKINSINLKLKKHNTQGIVISALDEIAWVLNLRGSDIEFNPVFYSYLIVTDHEIILFADNFRFDTKVQDILRCNHVKVLPYEEFWENLVSLSALFNSEKKKLLIPSNSSWEIFRSLQCPYEQVAISPIEELKAIKNKTELEGAKIAHLKDGRAIIKYLAWLENELLIKGSLIDEVEADDKLTEFRQQEENFIGLSFTTISASGANGAIIHYKPNRGSCSVINPEKIYLVDCGSQFLEGTTDTTRTVHFGKPSPDCIKHYTLVLKGNISLGKLRFPDNTCGPLLDSIARQYLWEEGLDYGHGTSHGVGAYLNVHEGPIGIGPRALADVTLKPGHLISNEPGYYEEGEYGIRIENMMYVKESGRQYAGRNFLEFVTVTRVPFCRALINVNLLTVEEKRWINEYHRTIWKEISPSLEKNSYTLNWLKRETAPL